MLGALFSLARGRTCVLVAHRLPTARTSDRIVVLADGVVVEVGTHDSLVRAVLAGRKTVTADLVEDYYRGYGELGEGGYAAGELIDTLDPRGRRRGTIRATTCPSLTASEGCRSRRARLPASGALTA